MPWGFECAVTLDAKEGVCILVSLNSSRFGCVGGEFQRWGLKLERNCVTLSN